VVVKVPLVLDDGGHRTMMGKAPPDCGGDSATEPGGGRRHRTMLVKAQGAAGLGGEAPLDYGGDGATVLGGYRTTEEKALPDYRARHVCLY